MLDTSKPLTTLTTVKKEHFMKGVFMKHFTKYWLQTLFVLGLSTLAFADSPFAVKFNDAGFNYYGGQKDTKTGYIHLAYEPGTLTVTLSEAESPLKIQYDEMKQASASDGKKKAWTKSVLVDHVKIYGFADGTKQGVTALHRKSYLAAVMKAYDEALTQLGFTGSTETDDTNLHIAIYQNGTDSVRVIFRRQGTDITVRMTEG
jgi:hypothetical protein